jgi:hypothetical protein
MFFLEKKLKPKDLYLCLYLTFLASLIIIPWLGFAGIFTRGEGREALVALDVLNGSLVLPRGYGDVIASKPPFLHWCIALLSYSQGKVTEFTARLPSAIFSIVFICFLWVFLRFYKNIAFATTACLLLFFSSEWVRASVICRVDMIHASTLATAILLLYHIKFLYQRKNLKIHVTIACLLSVSVLSKGIVAVLLATFIVIVEKALVYRKNFSRQEVVSFLKAKLVKSEVIFPIVIAFAKESLCLWYLIIPVLVYVLWYVSALILGGDEFISKVTEENFSRFSGTMKMPAHYHGIFFLFATIPLGLLPWAIWLPGLLYYVSSLSYFSIRVVILVIFFYSLPASKRSVYLLVCYPFFCIILAEFFSYYGRQLTRNCFWIHSILCRLFLLITFIFAVILVIDEPILNVFGLTAKNTNSISYYFIIRDSIKGILKTFLWYELALVSLIPILSFYSIWWSPQKLKYKSLSRNPVVLSFYSLIILTGLIVVQPVAHELSGTAEITRHVVNATHLEQPGYSHNKHVYSYGYEFYAVSFYSMMPFKSKTKPWYIGDLVLLRCKDIKKFSRNLSPLVKYTILYQQLPFFPSLSNSNCEQSSGKQIVLLKIVES